VQVIGYYDSKIAAAVDAEQKKFKKNLNELYNI